MTSRRKPSSRQSEIRDHLESGGTVCHEGRLGLGDAVRERELELGLEELLDVRPANILGLGNLNDTEDLM